MDLVDGRVLGGLLVGTRRGAGRLVNVTSSGDLVAVVHLDNQVTLHSLAGRRPTRGLFGRLFAVSEPAAMACIQNEAGVIDVFDLTALQRKIRLRLSATARLIQFSPDGKRLLVITADQVSRVFDTAALVPDPAVACAHCASAR